MERLEAAAKRVGERTGLALDVGVEDNRAEAAADVEEFYDDADLEQTTMALFVARLFRLDANGQLPDDQPHYGALATAMAMGYRLREAQEARGRE